jgi:hypothetical protein
MYTAKIWTSGFCFDNETRNQVPENHHRALSYKTVSFSSPRRRNSLTRMYAESTSELSLVHVKMQSQYTGTSPLLHLRVLTFDVMRYASAPRLRASCERTTRLC